MTRLPFPAPFRHRATSTAVAKLTGLGCVSGKEGDRLLGCIEENVLAAFYKAGEEPAAGVDAAIEDFSSSVVGCLYYLERVATTRKEFVVAILMDAA